MRRKIANLLFCLAKKLDSGIGISGENPHQSVKRLGIGYHLTKSDVRKFRCEHPEYSSHRKGLDALIEDTKAVIVGNITRGLYDKGCIEFKVKKTFWTADVTGSVLVYTPASTEVNYSYNGSTEEGKQ